MNCCVFCHYMYSSFYQLDNRDFYPNITKALILKAIEHAKKYADISDEDEKLILNTSESL